VPDVIVSDVEMPDVIRLRVRAQVAGFWGGKVRALDGLCECGPAGSVDLHHYVRLLARCALSQPFLQTLGGRYPGRGHHRTHCVRPGPGGDADLPPALPTAAMVVFDGDGLRVFCRACYLLPRLWDYLRLIVGAVGYRIQFAVAASRGVWREAQGQRGWGRIAHPGCNAPNSGANLD